MTITGFTRTDVPVRDTHVRAYRSGSGPALLLLHGFPESSLMWRGVAPILARRFTVVCADLPGYGESGCPPSTADHGRYSKRALASDLVDAMERLGLGRFSVAGHDRGGRVAYRLALDHADRIERVAVLDVIPTAAAWERADAAFALGFWPWSLLAQPEPLPERLVAAAPDAVVDHALGAWGTPSRCFDAEVRAAYVQALGDPVRVHAMCEEYRAAATVDRRDDEEDRRAGRRIEAPVLALWSRRGPLDHWYAAEGGPLAIWRRWAADADGDSVPGGHFFPEELPAETANALGTFMSAG